MDELTAGDQVLLHDEATVLTRFPDDDEKETWRGRPAKKVATFMDLAQTEQHGITKPPSLLWYGEGGFLCRETLWYAQRCRNS
jgi:hypothetical protein